MTPAVSLVFAGMVAAFGVFAIVLGVLLRRGPLFRWMGRGGVATTADGDSVMRFGGRHLVVGAALALFGLGVMTLGSQVAFAGDIAWTKGVPRFVVLLPFAAGAVTGQWGIMMAHAGYRRHGVVSFNADGLRGLGWFGLGEWLRWAAVESVRHKPFENCYDVVGDGRRVRVSCLLAGQEPFIRQCEAALPAAVYGNAFRGRVRLTDAP